MSNFYTSIVTGQNEPIGSRKWFFRRPTEVEWNDFDITFKPIAGQSIRIRESLEFKFLRVNIPSGSMIWYNRFYTEGFIGHYQVTRNIPEQDNRVLRTEEGQIIGYTRDSEIFTWNFQREYDLSLMLRKNDLRPAFLGVVYNCNADLAPGAVENRSINQGNVDKYVRLAYALATADLPNAATLLDSLTQPVINGFKFADEALFSTLNQIAAIDLENFIFTSRLGDIGMWVHPDWVIQPEAYYTVQVINFSPLAMSPNQIPESIACRYPGTLDFP